MTPIEAAKWLEDLADILSRGPPGTYLCAGRESALLMMREASNGWYVDLGDTLDENIDSLRCEVLALVARASVDETKP